MKLGHLATDAVVNSRGAGRSATFGIARNSQMFQILSSGLYSDKVSAVLREVGCNAYDAHVSIGAKETPFEVKLPTRIDRTFYIKDFGPGLDEKEIQNIYTVYGISTKSECYEQTGGFGLGSKSPFAYTLQDVQNPDGFTVISAKNGIERVYVAHLNNEGAPAITLLSERPASPEWPHGVSVQFPVQDKDFEEFSKKAKDVFKWFAVPPTIIGGSIDLECATQSLIPIGDVEGCAVYVPNSSNNPTSIYASNCNIVMANVRYTLSRTMVVDELSKNPLSSKALKAAVNSLLESGATFLVPNGSVRMTPSRESLQYDEHTLNFIINLCVNVVRSLAATWERELISHREQNLSLVEQSLALKKLYRDRSMYVKETIWNGLAEIGFSPERVSSLKQLVAKEAIVLPDTFGPRDDKQGYRIWEFVITDRQIFKKRVIGGNQVTATMRVNSKVSVAINPKTSLIYGVSGKRSEEIVVRNYASCLFKDSALPVRGGVLFFFEQLSEGPKDAAKHAVEAITCPGGTLSGINSMNVTTLSQALKPPKHSSSQIDASNSTTNIEDLEISVLCTDSLTVLSKTLKDIAPESRYYVTTSNAAKDVKEITSKGTVFSMNVAKACYSFRQFLRLAEIAGIQVPFIILQTSRAAKALEAFNRIGAKPFFSTVTRSALAKWSELLDNKPPILEKLGRSNYGHEQNLINTLAYLKSLKSPAWDALSARLPNSVIYAMACEVTEAPFNQKMNEFENAKRYSLYKASVSLFSLIPSLKRTIVADADSIKDELLKDFPEIAVFNTSKLMRAHDLSVVIRKPSNLVEKTLLENELESLYASITTFVSYVEQRHPSASCSLLERMLAVPSNEELLISFETFF